MSLKFCHPPELPQTLQAREISKNILTSPTEHTVESFLETVQQGPHGVNKIMANLIT